MKNKELLENQIGLFFANNFKGTLDEVSVAFKKILGNNTGTQTIDYPINNKVPPEVPRLIISAPGITVNFALNRVDLFSKSYEESIDNIKKIIDLLMNKFNIEFNRVGFVSNYLVKEELSLIKNQLFLEKIAMLDLKEITLRLNTATKIKGFECNNIQILQNGEIFKDGKIVDNGLMLQRDINTLEGNSNDYNHDSIMDLLNLFNSENKKIIFP